jgi:hypothetical protein
MSSARAVTKRSGSGGWASSMRTRRTFDELINHHTQEGHMDTAAMNIVTLMLTSLSYFVTFILGYGVRSYVYSHQRR